MQNEGFYFQRLIQEWQTNVKLKSLAEGKKKHKIDKPRAERLNAMLMAKKAASGAMKSDKDYSRAREKQNLRKEVNEGEDKGAAYHLRAAKRLLRDLAIDGWSDSLAMRKEMHEIAFHKLTGKDIQYKSYREEDEGQGEQHGYDAGAVAPLAVQDQVHQMKNRLKNFDWWYQMSDDHSVWKRGEANKTKLLADLQSMSVDDLEQLAQMDFGVGGQTESTIKALISRVLTQLQSAQGAVK